MIYFKISKKGKKSMPFGRFWGDDIEKGDYGYLESFKTINYIDELNIFEMYLGGSYHNFEPGLPEEFKEIL